MFKIIKLEQDDFDSFFEYLNHHISENGAKNNLLFLPLSKTQSHLNTPWKEDFVSSLNSKTTDSNWCKIWIAINQDHKIVGHVDIRSHGQLNTEHRVLLGM